MDKHFLNQTRFDLIVDEAEELSSDTIVAAYQDKFDHVTKFEAVHALNIICEEKGLKGSPPASKVSLQQT